MVCKEQHNDANHRWNKAERSGALCHPGEFTLLGCYVFLMMPTINRSKAAPAVAVMIEPINPPAEIPSKPKTKPPNTAPITPMTILPSRPNPPPFIKVPANQPATAPIAKNIINPVMSIHSPLLLQRYLVLLQPNVSVQRRRVSAVRCNRLLAGMH